MLFLKSIQNTASAKTATDVHLGALTPMPFYQEARRKVMAIYTTIKFLHLLLATALLGAGLGIIYFNLRAHWTDNLHEKYFAARHTFFTDTLLTLPAIVLQPLTGFWLLAQADYNPTSGWLLATFSLYLVSSIFWLPVLWIQGRMKNILVSCLQNNLPIPPSYHTLFTCWFFLGWPAFISLIIVSTLLITKIQ